MDRSDSSETQSFDLPVQMNNGQWIISELEVTNQ